MAAELLYFHEDEIFRLNKKGNVELGMVLETSESLSSDEEDDECDGNIRHGYIRVAWHPSGMEEILPEKKVCNCIIKKNIFKNQGRKRFIYQSIIMLGLFQQNLKTHETENVSFMTCLYVTDKTLLPCLVNDKAKTLKYKS